jgi:transcriptional regulator of arginine metabolism
MTIPQTKVARQSRIAELLLEHDVRSQSDLVELLGAEGIEVTQATVSRDLVELGAVRLRGQDGHLVYVVADDGLGPADAGAQAARLARLAEELVVGVEASANLVVVRTPPGGAQFLASSIDHGGLPGVIGTVAGDDTVLLVTKDPHGGADVAQALLLLTDARPSSLPVSTSGEVS